MRAIYLASVLVAATLLGSVAMAPSALAKSPIARAPKDQTRADDLWDKQYCELFLGYSYAAKMNFKIFNTIGFNYCPKDKVSTFPDKLKTFAAENAADTAMLNGPRHWVLDAIEGGDVSGSGETKNFGGIEMSKVATTDVPFADLTSMAAPYAPMQIARTTVWIYDKGRAVFELVDPKGNVYVMQAYSQQEDPNLKIPDLPALGPRLKLPAGWTYRTETLRKELRLDAHGLATIVHDILKDTYMLDTGLKRH